MTGGLGAGKSTALEALERLGAATLSTDAVVHDLYGSDEVRDAVVERWGEDVAPGGIVDRAAIARHAFADPEDRAWLEGLLWPLVAARVIAFRQEVERRDPPPPAAVVEIPLLFESGMESAYDATIAVVADEEVRASRARAWARGGRRARGASADAGREGEPRHARRPQQRYRRTARGRVVARSCQAEGMTTRSAATRTTRARAAAGARRRAQRRRRVMALLATATLTALAAFVVWPVFHHAVREITLPLRHEDIIRQQARDKGLDPALIAAVIYAESRFVDGRTSAAGAQGLMQLTPATASYIARKSGGIAFEISDLETPQVNIAYGSYYLRYLLDNYGGNETLALAAYNAGEGNVDRWIDEARKSDRALTIEAIPFGETRAYVDKVNDAKRDYRDRYARELGLRGRFG